MSKIDILNYTFEIVEKPDLQETPGVYVILSDNGNNKYGIVDVGESVKH